MAYAPAGWLLKYHNRMPARKGAFIEECIGQSIWIASKPRYPEDPSLPQVLSQLECVCMDD